MGSSPHSSTGTWSSRRRSSCLAMLALTFFRTKFAQLSCVRVKAVAVGCLGYMLYPSLVIVVARERVEPVDLPLAVLIVGQCYVVLVGDGPKPGQVEPY